MKDPRSIRNNNPLNLRVSSDKWQGQTFRPDEREFCVFTTMAYGFRAAFKTLHTYYHKHHLKTLSSILWRWAPPVENNTCNYCHAVHSFMLFVDDWRTFTSQGQYLPPPEHHPIIWQNLALAMCKVESGSEAFAQHEDELKRAVTAGYKLAFAPLRQQG